MATDPTWSHLVRLQPELQQAAFDFINEARSWNQLPAIITSSTRTTAQQAALVKAGRSTTMNSKHLYGLAFDVDMLGWARDRVPTWVWDELGPVGEALGLTWGGRWVSFRDVGHFEL